MKDNTADQLYPVVFHTQHTLGSFPHSSKGFRKKIVQSLSFLQAVFKFSGFSLQFLIGQCLHVRTEGFYLIYNRCNTF